MKEDSLWAKKEKVSTMPAASTFVTVYHAGCEGVNDKTRVVFVGPFVNEVVYTDPKTRQQKRLTLDQPTHNSHPAGFLEVTNLLFVAIDPPKETA